MYLATAHMNVHRTLESNAQSHPSKTAVICESSSITYGELNRRANQLAHYLTRLGVGPDIRVGICLERGIEMIVSIFGVLKAGGAYVPFDPAYPAERLAYILNDTQVALLITEATLEKVLPDSTARRICLDTTVEIWTEPVNDLERDAHPESLAYVVYTSGSTGHPKGVMITHANLAAYVKSLPAQLGVGPNDRYLHTASISFSSSVRQFTAPLSLGATLVVATKARISDPVVLLREVKKHGVTIIDIVPSYWRSCILALDDLDAPTRTELLDNQLRKIFSASEPLLCDLPERWAFTFQHPASLTNMFGQTETTGIATTHPIPREKHGKAGVVHVGKALQCARVVLLDESLRQVPADGTGEIHIGGTTVGRGYLGQPHVTAEKFIPDPSSSTPGQRLYRTGDLGRILPDGTLEFLGRGDHQIKIRGFRVEPGEIEVLLTRLPGIRKAVVVLFEPRPGDKRLVAYVETGSENASIGPEVRERLKEQLPDYMVPSAYVALQKLPMTPNGKIDRKNLPPPNLVDEVQSSPGGQPRNDIEACVAKIWAEVLGREPIGRRDDFFELGGHSLLVIQVMSRLTRLFHVQVPLRNLFEQPTVEALAIAVVAAEPKPGYAEKIARVVMRIESMSQQEKDTRLRHKHSGDTEALSAKASEAKP